MHALVVRVTIHNPDRTREVLNFRVVPQVSGAPGFQDGLLDVIDRRWGRALDDHL
jgi:hypothetical protein